MVKKRIQSGKLKKTIVILFSTAKRRLDCFFPRKYKHQKDICNILAECELYMYLYADLPPNLLARFGRSGNVNTVHIFIAP